MANQHDAGKLSARERIDRLLDPDSFAELDRFKTHRRNDFNMDVEKTPAAVVGTVMRMQLGTDDYLKEIYRGNRQTHSDGL